MVSNVKARSYGIDVANYQSTNVSYPNTKFVLVKLTEGQSYVNSKAAAQIQSAKTHDLLVMGYFFATFGYSNSRAQKEAAYACQKAKELGVPVGSYIACDWETGDGNNVNGGQIASAKAIITALEVISSHGYKPLFYSSASLMRTNVATDKIVKQFGTCLWIAAYPISGATYKPLFAYFPSRDGIAIWQFTDNYRGLRVDGNISLIDLQVNEQRSIGSKTESKSIWHKKRGVFILGQALELHTSPHVSAPAIAKLPRGSEVEYDATLQGPLRLWLRQPRSNGTYGYIVAKDKFGKTLGKFV